MAIKGRVKKLVGKRGVSFFHYLKAQIAALYFGYPTKNLVVIGIVGTKGKTTAANFIWSCLNKAGLKASILSTANIRIDKEGSLNEYHMTMPGPLVVQRFFKETLKRGCSFAIIEATSEGIKQFRHKGIAFDFLVFTNLTPEHLPSHEGSFKKYKETKGRVFGGLADYPDKHLVGRDIKKTIIANIDDEHSNYFLNFKAEKKISFSVEKESDYQAENLEADDKGTDFFVNGKSYRLNLLGDFNVYNALPAIIISDLLSIDYEATKQGLFDLKVLPGRMEVMDLGQDFTVLVDYAHEPRSIEVALKASRNLVKGDGKLIILLGAEGGGRDKAKRPLMGKLAGELADVVIVSNVDPYDDDPEEIIKDIAMAVGETGKVINDDFFVIENRRDGIRKCLELGESGDVILITGKGAEQSMIIKNQKIPWDDRKIVKEELQMLI